ncbi:MAG: bifunctional glutamate N-acetyltransferase/amino-acid acetyltransferase ArgJ [Spirochaetia bacterium]
MSGRKQKKEYQLFLKNESQLPKGFSAGSVKLEFSPTELETASLTEMDLSLLYIHGSGYSSAGVFTKNAFPGAPVILCKKQKGNPIKGILVNNKIANVCSPTGLQDAESVVSALARYTGERSNNFFMASTGVIGWSLPTEKIVQKIPELYQSISESGGPDFAKGIMTTDRFPKVRRAVLPGGSIVGFAKGAGMVEPDMATMLSFIITDIPIQSEHLQQALSEAAQKSFNRISIDSDQSTSDMVLAISSGLGKACKKSEFTSALTRVCDMLAKDIVRNGEGTSHVIEVRVSGAEDESQAAQAGKAIVNSPLVKTAIYGNDPNVGRIAAALGSFFGSHGISNQKAVIKIGGETVFENNAFNLTPEKEKRIQKYLDAASFSETLKGYPEHQKSVAIDIILSLGNGDAIVYGSDLSHEYIHENADYRT